MDTKEEEKHVIYRYFQDEDSLSNDPSLIARLTYEEKEKLRSKEYHMLNFLVRNEFSIEPIIPYIIKRDSVVTYLDSLFILKKQGIDINTDEIFIKNIQAGKINNLEYLMGKGSLACLQNPECLCEAIKSKNINTIKLLIEYGANLNIDGKENNSLLLAIEDGNYEVLDYLMHKCDNPKSLCSSAFIKAIRSGQINVIKSLYDHGVDYSPVKKEAVMESIHNWHLPMVKFFIENESDIEIKNHALLQAFVDSKLDIASYLIKSGADIQFDNNVILKETSKRGNLKAVKCLVGLGCDLSIAEEHGMDEVRKWANSWDANKAKPKLAI